MSARLIGSRTFLRDPSALARFIRAWNDGVEVRALSSRFNLGYSTCLLLAKRLRAQGEAVRSRRSGGGVVE